MKKLHLFLVTLITFSLSTFFVACEKDEKIDLTTISVSNEQCTPSYTSATLQCSFATKATLRNVYVQYATKQDFAEYKEREMSRADDVYIVVLDGLQENTTYYIRYAVSNRYSSAMIEEISTFQTLQPSVPTITLKSISDIWDTHAKAEIALEFDGGSQISEMGICWDIQTMPALEKNIIITKDTSAILDITSLQPNTKYYVRAYAKNKVGITYSEEMSFITLTLPEVQTVEIKDIGVTSAILNGTLTFNGNDTAIVKGFCWSEKAEPTIADTYIQIDTIASEFSYHLSNLKDETKYHVRAYAKNKIGIAYGDIVAFATKAADPPVVLTTTATEVFYHSATVDGNVTSDGGASVTERGVVYSTNQNPTTASSKVTSGNGVGSFTCNLTNLQENTKYYVRAYAINKKGTGYGPQASFTTKAYALPTLTTSSATNISYTSATIGGNVTSDGGASVTERGVVYSTSSNPTTSNNKVTSGSGTGSFTCSLTNLQEGTTYYVRAYAINEKGTAYGAQKSFTTSSVALPTVTTSSATNISKTSATVGGNVTSDGGTSVTARGIVYSTVSNPVINNIYHTTKVVGSGTGSFSVNLTNLIEGTTYYVRAYATNEKGTAYGNQVVFTTLEAPNENGHEYVDLGLSVKWATCNVGASRPEDYGDYFAWGETQPKSTYDLSTNKYWNWNGSGYTLTKYNTKSSLGTVDNKNTLDLSDDAARANWGGSWRMPTKVEQDELLNNCTWTWTTQNGVEGYKVTSKSNSNSIFLPAAGHRDGSTLYRGSGHYWSSSLIPDNPYRACELYFYSGTVLRSENIRVYGLSVRPVYGEYIPASTLPTVTTSSATNISKTSATVGGNVTSDGGASVTERGVVYSTSSNPTTSNSKVTSGSGTGSFTCNLTNLAKGTTYYVRAYATNEKGTAYGNQVVFTTLEAPNENGHEYVDLGLSVKWATCNVGASSPEDYGDYFAWGETQPKSTYTWSTYKYCNGTSTTLTKYNTDSSCGTVDNKKVLVAADDAACANWGGSWRMPTETEQEELRKNCTWTWTTQNGVKGYKVTSKSNGNSIFLPAAGLRNGSSLSNAGSDGDYWSSSLYTDLPSYAFELYFLSDCVYGGLSYRYFGLSVRPVCP